MAEYVGKLLVDGADEEFVVQQLEVEFDFADETTADAVLNDLEEALSELGMRIQIPRKDCAISFGDPVLHAPGSTTMFVGGDILMNSAEVRAFYDLNQRSGEARAAVFYVVPTPIELDNRLRWQSHGQENSAISSSYFTESSAMTNPNYSSAYTRSSMNRNSTAPPSAYQHEPITWSTATSSRASPPSTGLQHNQNHYYDRLTHENATPALTKAIHSSSTSPFSTVPSWAADVNRPVNEGLRAHAAELVAEEAASLIQLRDGIVGREHWSKRVNSLPNRVEWIALCKAEAALYNELADSVERKAHDLESERSRKVDEAEAELAALVEEIEQRKDGLAKRRVLQERLDKLKMELDVQKEREQMLMAELQEGGDGGDQTRGHRADSYATPTANRRLEQDSNHYYNLQQQPPPPSLPPPMSAGISASSLHTPYGHGASSSVMSPVPGGSNLWNAEVTTPHGDGTSATDISELRALAARLSQHFRSGTGTPQERETLLQELRSVRERVDQSSLHGDSQIGPSHNNRVSPSSSETYRDVQSNSAGNRYQFNAPPPPNHSYIRPQGEGSSAIRWGDNRNAGQGANTEYVGPYGSAPSTTQNFRLHPQAQRDPRDLYNPHPHQHAAQPPLPPGAPPPHSQPLIWHKPPTQQPAFHPQ